MARKKPQVDDQGPPLMLPAPRVTHRHERDVDAYASPVGAVPGRTIKQEPIHRDLTAEEKAEQTALRKSLSRKGQRYDQWLDALIKHGGVKVKALMEVCDITEEEAYLRQYELEAEIRQGMGTSDIADTLVRNDLTTAAQVNILRGWAYSENAAASIAALKTLHDMTGDTTEKRGSWEQFLRIYKMQKGMNS